MNAALNRRPVLMAEDDPDDRELTSEALRLAAIENPVRVVADGEKLIDYLTRCLASGECECVPALIMLDLNMPRMDGREALGAIRRDPRLGRVPVVVWTTSNAEEDRQSARAGGCDAYLTKPSSFGEMVEQMRALRARWLSGADEPPAGAA